MLISRNIVANRRNTVKRAIKCICLLSLCVLAFALAGCGASKDNELLERKTQAVEKDMMTFAVDLEKYRGLSDAQVKEYLNTIESYKRSNQITEDQAKVNEDIIKDWHDIEGDLGKFQDYGEFEFDSAGKTYTATLNLKYANRDAKLVYVISKKDFTVTGANIEMIYTLGEKMSKAGLNTVTGILIVFFMLVFMCVVIYAFNIIAYIQEKYNRKKEQTKIEITSLEGSDDSEEKEVDDKELIAVIAAAIAASTNQSTDDFVVRSIRRRS